MVKVNNLETGKVELEFTVDKESFNRAYNAEYKKQVASINMPGFRKGKVPRSVLEKMYGKGVFLDKVANDFISEEYEATLKEHEFKIISNPEMNIDTENENCVVITVGFYVYPEVTVKEYKGIKVTRTVDEVTDEAVDADISRAQQRNARTIEITDRAAEMNDIVNIDYEGSVDGVLFDGGAAQGHDLKLGSGAFIPGFEDQIVGHKIGEEFNVEVTFPEEYHASDLAGKAAVFATKLNTIKHEELPELDDEFAKDVSEFATFAEYKADVKAKLTERNERIADGKVNEQLMQKLSESLECVVPVVMVEREAENMVRDYDTRLRMQGLDLDTYFKYTGQSLDTLRAQFMPDAEKQVKTRLALEKIAELEEITVTDEEISEEYEKLSQAYGVELDRVKELVEDSAIADDIKVNKAYELVRAEAKITKKKAAAKKTEAKAEDAEAEEKPAAKKTTAKKTTTKKATESADAEKKPAAKKTVAKKTEAKSEGAEEKPAAKKTTAKKTTAKKAADKNTEDK